jgi:hypothetical protein
LARKKYEDEVECLLSLYAGFTINIYPAATAIERKVFLPVVGPLIRKRASFAGVYKRQESGDENDSQLKITVTIG